jgi:hypothetical protein
MSTHTSTQEKLFLYAVTAGLDRDKPLGPIGLDGGTVYAITNHHLSGVVSAVGEKLRPQRRHLAAHQDVLRRLMTETDAVLPVTFGLVVDGQDAVRLILSRHAPLLRENLRRVTGRVEMGLQVTWDVPNIFEHFVATHHELRAARDRLVVGCHEPSHSDKLEVGRLFERVLMGERDARHEQVEEALAPFCVEFKRNRPRNEREAVNLVCLVERERQEDFEAAVFAAAASFDNSFAFDYNGPWAPHNFVDLELDLATLRRTRHAEQRAS